MVPKVHKGYLLYGPPGTGKTYFVEQLAKEIGIPLIDAVGSEFQSSGVWEKVKLK
ncbi:MAG: AAA family ATPase [Candidatus Phytoplasma sp. TWB_XP]